MTAELIVNLFDMATPGHLAQGLWRHPQSTRLAAATSRFWIDQARRAEEALVDALFLADVLGVYEGYRGSRDTAVREGVQVPNYDPLLLIPVMAAATEHLGFVATSTTSYEAPFSFARRASTLDHLTEGRFGWNIVTSYLPNAARNFGLAEEIPHDDRYAIAEEFLEVVYKLWEGSWDEGAVLADPEAGLLDPDRVHAIDHVGAHFRVAGPHLVDPSRQRTPVLFQAGASSTGLAFAGRHAECVFVGGSTAEVVARNVQAIRRAAEEAGRDPASVKVLAELGVVTGADAATARRRLDELDGYASIEGYLAKTAGGGPDLLAHDPDELVEEVNRRHGAGTAYNRFPPGTTVREAVDSLRSIGQGAFFAVGSGVEVADRIEEWAAQTGLDGFNLRQALTPGTLDDFAEHVVPHLQARGLYRTAYTGGSLRDRLFGAGDRLPDSHPAAAARGAFTQVPPARR
ncbi:MAG: NtaA/DmoA family FMN-dependent monooxygenase [Protaetiibacter sp.]